MLEPAADIPVEDISEELVEKFSSNQIDEPLESDRDTTPAASTIKFLGGMLDEE